VRGAGFELVQFTSISGTTRIRNKVGAVPELTTLTLVLPTPETDTTKLSHLVISSIYSTLHGTNAHSARSMQQSPHVLLSYRMPSNISHISDCPKAQQAVYTLHYCTHQVSTDVLCIREHQKQLEKQTRMLKPELGEMGRMLAGTRSKFRV